MPVISDVPKTGKSKLATFPTILVLEVLKISEALPSIRLRYRSKQDQVKQLLCHFYPDSDFHFAVPVETVRTMLAPRLAEQFPIIAAEDISAVRTLRAWKQWCAKQVERHGKEVRVKRP